MHPWISQNVSHHDLAHTSKSSTGAVSETQEFLDPPVDSEFCPLTVVSKKRLCAVFHEWPTYFALPIYLLMFYALFVRTKMTMNINEHCQNRFFLNGPKT